MSITRTDDGAWLIIIKMGKRFEYEADDVKKRVPQRKPGDSHRLRKGLKPGTVVILLAGKHQGKRAVFLKQLKSGLLLITGPYKVNGVPLRRVNQKFVIVTSTTVDVNQAAVKDVNDAFFDSERKDARKALKKLKGEKEFFAEKAKRVISDDRRKLQQNVDASVKLGDSLLKKYLGARFSLSNNDVPHLMAF